MGIQGLLPFLKKIHKPVNISEFQGCTVAIDAYCWLHKGAFSCAEKLALGEKTDQYVYYCMKYIDYMLKNNIKPILVFDGCHLKSKADVEKTRRERRELNRKKAAQFLREGKRGEAKECLQRCVDITPQMALELMNACRDKGVDCIVAPYEADAQLAYLNLKGIAQIIVTEDSDLLLFGCEKIIFKMDFYGNGTLIEKSHLNEVLAMQGGIYTFEKFRHMCILSGCDYLSSLPGIGLVKASKVFKTARQPDLSQLLKKLPTYLKMNLVVTEEYIEGFIRAENTFLYQLVFDPLSRKLCPLNPYPPEINPDDLDYAGQYLPDEKAYQIALGNIDIHNHRCISYFDPDRFQPKYAAKPKFRYELSIWDKNYAVKGGSPCKTIQVQEVTHKSLHDKVQIVKVRLMKSTGTKKRQLEVSDPPDMKTDEELISMYGPKENQSPDAKRVKHVVMEDSMISSLTQSNSQLKSPFFASTPAETCKEQQHTESLAEDSDEEQDSYEETSSMPDRDPPRHHPSQAMSAADIGEEAFKGSKDKTAENSLLSPTKARNVFAVSPNEEKTQKFSLDSFPVEVKSRYFHNINKNSSPAKQKVSPSARKSPSSLQKRRKIEPQKSIQEMFKRTPPVKMETMESKEKLETNHLTRKESHSAKDFFKHLKDTPTVVIKEEPECEIEGQGFLKHEANPISVLNKFQSTFYKAESEKSKVRSRSVFTWSNSNIQPKQTESNINKVLPNDSQSPGVNKQSVCGDRNGLEETLMSESTRTIFLSKNSYSEFPKEKSTKLKHFYGTSQRSAAKLLYSANVAEKMCELPMSQDDEGEVTELKSYSYETYLNSLNHNGQSAPEEGESPYFNSINDKKSDSFSECHDSSQRSSSSALGTSLSSVQDEAIMGSQRYNLSSIDSGCMPTSQNVVDLTDAGIESQNSCTSSLSRQSSTGTSSLSRQSSTGTSSLSRQSSTSTSSSQVCRVSGLSRNKNNKLKSTKNNLEKSPGQRSIVDLISKFKR